MRRPGRSARFVAAACLVAACRTPPPAETVVPVTLSRTVASDAFEIPSQLMGLERTTVKDWEEPSLGFGASYRSPDRPGLRADVFVYPIDLPAGTSLADSLDREHRELESEIALVASTQRLSVQSVSVEAHVPRPGGLLPPGLLGYRELTGPDGELASWSFLTVRHDLFFKLRLTASEPGAEGATRRDFEGFLESVSGSLRAREPHARELALVVTDRAELSDGGCGAGWLAYGLAMLEALQQGAYLDSFERERAVRTTALDVFEEASAEAEPDARCASAAFSALSRARQSGLLDEYVWHAYRKPYWQPPRGLDRDRYAAWSDAELDAHDPVRDPGLLVRWGSAP